MSALLLADAKTHLHITVATFDVQLQKVIDAAEDWVAQRTGPLTAVPGLTQTYDGGTLAVLLPSGATTVTTVTENGVATTDYTANLKAGIVYAGSQIAPRAFFPGRQNIVVTYTGFVAGFSSVPEGLLFVIKEKVRELWATQRGSGTRRPGSAQPEQTADIESLLAPYVQLPGFA